MVPSITSPQGGVPPQAPPAPPSQSAPRSGKIWAVLGAIVLVLAAGYFVYAWYYHAWPFEIDSSMPVSLMPIADWHDYKNEQFGFGLTLTDAWQGYSTETLPDEFAPGVNYVNFLVPASDTADGWANPFRIGVYPDSVWADIEGEEGPKPGFLASRGGYSYAYTAWQDPPESLWNVGLDVNEVVNSFHFLESDPTAGWKEYSDAATGVSFRYPPNYTADSAGGGYFSNPRTQEKVGVSYNTDTSGQAAEWAQAHWFDQNPVGSASVGGYAANKFAYQYCDGPGCGTPQVAYVVLYRGHPLAIDFIGDLAMSEVEEQILSTVRFVEPNPEIEGQIEQLSYRNSQYGFAMDLPAGWAEYEEEYLRPTLAGTTDVIRVWHHRRAFPQEERSYVAILVYTPEQWSVELAKDQPHPIELGRSAQYVFAYPFRYDYTGLPGEADINAILETFYLSSS